MSNEGINPINLFKFSGQQECNPSATNQEDLSEINIHEYANSSGSSSVTWSMGNIDLDEDTVATLSFGGIDWGAGPTTEPTDEPEQTTPSETKPSGFGGIDWGAGPTEPSNEPSTEPSSEPTTPGFGGIDWGAGPTEPTTPNGSTPPSGGNPNDPNWTGNWSSLSEDEAVRKARQLNKSMKGWGTDTKALNNIVMGSSREELHDIIAQYPGGVEELIKHIEDDTSGQYQAILVRTIENAAYGKYGEHPNDKEAASKLAYQIFDSVEGAGTDEDSLYAVFLDSSDEKIKEIAQFIKDNPSEFNNLSLREMILDDFSGDDHDALKAKLDRLGL